MTGAAITPGSGSSNHRTQASRPFLFFGLTNDV